MDIAQQIAAEISIRPQQVQAAIDLLDDGSTVPFIARYRKEVTRGLDDTQLRRLQERLSYLRELEQRRNTVLETIGAQGKLDAALKAKILRTTHKTELEDLYLPYKPKRRTKAQLAREAGLLPLAEVLLNDRQALPDIAAREFVDSERGVPDVDAALEGARHLIAEQIVERAELVGELREHLWQHGVLFSRVLPGKAEEGSNFRDYFQYQEPIHKIPSHRALALFRGRNAGILALNLDVDSTAPGQMHPCAARMVRALPVSDRGRPADDWIRATVSWTWKAKLAPRLQVDLFGRLRERSESAAIEVFAKNLHDLLLAPPAGSRTTIGLDPGLRTGVKVAVIDATGKLLDTRVIYPHAPKSDWDGAIRVLATLAAQYQASLIAIGNGTASRETDRLVAELISRHPELELQKALVSEAGASVYSASESAALELPEVDVTLRGAVSIGRRLQDPLSELVKIDPQSIGVGQYQHDVNQGQLGRALSGVVEDCVNAVGVDVNTASADLLSYVSGLSRTLASNIVEYRHQNGAFSNRKKLAKVPRLGHKTFEQCAGFLRIRGGENVLDTTAVHPEAYPVVQRIAESTDRAVANLIGDHTFLAQLDPGSFADARFGLPTVRDILLELEKPGRDPRPAFETAQFRADVEHVADLEVGMKLEGVVTNVTHFGAFVDIGVHQDGLVHISEMADRFVKDPHEVVAAGKIVQVRVIAVDVKRKRVGLSMRASERRATETQVEQHADKDRGKRASGAHRNDVRGHKTGNVGDALLRARKR